MAARRLAVGAFLALHGLVHLWYVVLSGGWIEADPGMGWNGHSWLLSSVLPAGTILALASVLYAVVALGFVVGGAGYARRQEWAGRVLVPTALLSTAVLIAMWDGRFDMLVEKGVLGVLINLGIVGVLLGR